MSRDYDLTWLKCGRWATGVGNRPIKEELGKEKKHSERNTVNKDRERYRVQGSNKLLLMVANV
jgi:hypothetical protein